MPNHQPLMPFWNRSLLFVLLLGLVGSTFACEDPYSKPPPGAKAVTRSQPRAVPAKNMARKTNGRNEPPRLLPARPRTQARKVVARQVPKAAPVVRKDTKAAPTTRPAARNDKVDTTGINFKMDTPKLGGDDSSGLGLGTLKLKGFGNDSGGGLGTGGGLKLGGKLGGDSGNAAPTSQPANTAAPTTRPAARTVGADRVNPKDSMFSKKYLKALGINTQGKIGTAPATLEVPDVLAVVNSQKIRKANFVLALSAAKRLLKTSGVSMSRMERWKHLLYRKVLNTLLDQALLYQEALQKGYKHDSAKNKKMMGMVLARLNKNPRLMAYFQASGMTRQEVIQNLRQQVVTQQYLKTLARGIRVDNAKLMAAYKKTVGRKKHEVRQILIAVDKKADPSKRRAALSKAMQILSQVKQFPAQFAALAKKHSDDGSASSGGDLGYLTQGETIKELDEAIFKMNQGEIRGPVRSPIGYHILQVTSVKQPPSFAKSKFRLAYRFQMMQLQKLMKKEAKELREGADIKVLVPWGR